MGCEVSLSFPFSIPISLPVLSFWFIIITDNHNLADEIQGAYQTAFPTASV